ncbi:MAG: Hsp33 family molecular chaperone HslO [Helcococcus sp.]|nr:Hsp33 family molecular chaperone HslO [Helcococcus sp.]
MKNYIIRAIDKTKSVRIFISTNTEMVQEIRNIHDSQATASAAMGRLAIIASIMAYSSLDDNQSLTIVFDGKGPAGKLRAVADDNGDVKVTVTNPKVDVPSRYPGKLDVGAYVGKNGTLAVIKDLGLKEPYTGISNIITGEIAEDLANYYFYSEQTPSIISLGVLVDTDLSIKSAGGIFVQVLPGITEEELDQLQNIANNLRPVSELINEGKSPEEILEEYFSELEPEILEKHEINYKCDCSRDRIRSGLISIGKKDLLAIIEEDKKAEVICDFCKTVYNFDEKKLREMLKESK